ncbi:putative malate dehydrogenase 1B [Discoglossus pictus]
MAKFVLAGRADCPYYAKAEVLANYLQENLPNFRVHKITQHPQAWEQWLEELCKKNNWKHNRSPIIWRELLDRGGKGLLLGGFNDFMEHAQEYYNITSDMMTDLMKDISGENLITKLELLDEEDDAKRQFNPMHIWITSASSPVCYILIPLLVNGGVFGKDKEIWLHLLDDTSCADILNGLVMETEDLAFPPLRRVTMHSLTDDAFLYADVVIVLDDALPKPDQCTEAYMKEATDLCAQYGQLINQNANKAVKVVVAGSSYVNLKALVIMTSAPSIQQHNVVALSTQLEHEAKAMLCHKLSANIELIRDLIVWGNISGTTYLDLEHAKVYHYDSAVWGPPTFFRPLLSMIHDSKWMTTNLLSEWNKMKQNRTGLSAALCIAKFLSWWYQDTCSGQIVSLGVISEGQFNLPEGIVFSAPVKFENGMWRVCTHLSVSEEGKEAMLKAAEELVKEKNIFLGILPESKMEESPIIETEDGIVSAVSEPAEEHIPTEENIPSEEHIPDEEIIPDKENVPDKENLPAEVNIPDKENIPPEEKTSM